MNSMTIVPTPVTRNATGNGYTIDIGKGSHLVLNGSHGNSPYEVFMMALMGSISRGGKPVRCTNFIRGVSLLLDSTMPPVAGQEAESLFDFIYAGLVPPLKAWLRQQPDGEPFCHEILGITARFAHNSRLEWLPGVLQIDVEEPRRIEEFVTSVEPVTVATPMSPDRKQPLSAPAGESQKSQHEHVAPPGGMSPTIRRALECNLYAMSPEYARIPFPVRFRASGALDAWAEVRRAAGARGARLQAKLADPRVGPYDSLHDCLAIVDTTIDPDAHKAEFRQLMTVVALSLPSQAFWIRKGALFEPTDALEQLLKLSDVGDDMPLAIVTHKTQAFCIVPGQGLHHEPDGVNSIMIFDHAGSSAETVGDRCLTFIVAREILDTDHRRLPVTHLSVPIDDETMTIRQAIERHYYS